MSIDRLTAALSDRYRIERELGQGGMATVYLAQDLKHDRKVAVKVLKPELAAVIGADRFVVEIKTTAALQHPHILPLFDSGTAYGPDKSGPYLYYVMPYIEGETLRAKLDRETQLGVDEAVKLTVAVADALDYAHRHGVIHRDIKPENILLHDGRPIVADFGIALALSAAAGGRMTETGMSLGTPHYMSPEQATADKEISGRSDIYSLGSVLYEMLAGQPPHLGGSAQQIIMKIISEPVPPVTTYRKSVPPNVSAALSRALEKLAADRFGSAKEFAQALEDRGFTVAGMAAATGVRQDRRSARLVPALSAVALAALALAAWGWLRPSKPTAAVSWQNEISLGEARFQGSAAIAPDGSFLIYSASIGGRLQLWLRRSSSVEPVAITGTENGSMPAISPDGKRVAFITSDGRLLSVPVEGGQATIVSGEPANFWDKVDWTDDGHLLYSSYNGLRRFPATGGSPEQLSRVDSAQGEGLHGFPAALPDHRGVIFTIWPTGDFALDKIRIGVVGPDGGKHAVLLPGLQAVYVPGYLIVLHADGSFVRVPFDPATRRVTGPELPLGLSAGRVSANAAIGLPTVATDGRMLWSASDAEGRADLVRVSRNGTVLEVDSSWPGLPNMTSASADGGRLAAVVIASGRDDIWNVLVKEVRTGAMIQLSTPGIWDQAPTFSRDGRTLVFAGTSSERDVIYRKVLGSAGALEELIEGEPGSLGGPTLSPDGGILYFTRHGEVMAHRLSAPGDPDQLVVAANGTAAAPVPSPDGKWLAYISGEGARTEVYVRSTDPARAERWQISTTGASVAPARWSANGRELYYVARDSVIAAQVTSGTTFAVTGQKALFSMADYVVRAFVTPLPNGEFLLVRPRQTGAAYRLMMVDDWKSMGAPH